jgi:hypothetical protein
MGRSLKFIANEFLQRDPLVLLFVSVAISLMAGAILYFAAKSEGVLHINGGVGFLQNYGLLATLIGNAMLPYLARTYCDQVREISRSTVTTHGTAIHKEMRVLTCMLRLEGKYIYILYLLFMIGAMFWISNVSFHFFGYSKAHWGNVFDSLQHLRSFSVNRLNNVYSWIIIFPFCGYVVLLSSIQLVRAISKAAKDDSIRYDLLNPDNSGGFAAVGRAHLTFNFLLAITYLQIVLYTTTFKTTNIEHIVAYFGLTLVFIFGNSIFMADANRQIKRLRIEALNVCKERAYSGDNLQFQILKYALEIKPKIFSLIDFATKAVVIAISFAIKFGPSLLSSYGVSLFKF